MPCKPCWAPKPPSNGFFYNNQVVSEPSCHRKRFLVWRQRRVATNLCNHFSVTRRCTQTIRKASSRHSQSLLQATRSVNTCRSQSGHCEKTFRQVLRCTMFRAHVVSEGGPQLICPGKLVLPPFPSGKEVDKTDFCQKYQFVHQPSLSSSSSFSCLCCCWCFFSFYLGVVLVSS